MNRRDLIKGLAGLLAGVPRLPMVDAGPMTRTPQEVASANAKALSKRGFVSAHLRLTAALVGNGKATTRTLDGSEGPVVSCPWLAESEEIPVGANVLAYWLVNSWCVVMTEA